MAKKVKQSLPVDVMERLKKWANRTGELAGSDYRQNRETEPLRLLKRLIGLRGELEGMSAALDIVGITVDDIVAVEDTILKGFRDAAGGVWLHNAFDDLRKRTGVEDEPEWTSLGKTKPIAKTPAKTPLTRAEKSLQSKLQNQLNIDSAKAEQIAVALAGAHTHEEVDSALDTASNLLGFYGVEPIRGDYQVDNYYLDIVALYVNSGDTYTPTIIYETETGKFIIWTLGDWVEKNQRKYKIL